MKQKQLVGAAAFLFLLICFACLFIEPGSGIWQEGLNEVQEKHGDTMVEVMQQMRKKDRAQVFRSTNIVWLSELWYKYYSGGWCTWPTPLKYPESKSNEA